MKKQKTKNMTKFVITALVHIDIFTIICLIGNFVGKPIQEALITGFFSVFTGELAGMLLKKLLDNRRKNKKDEGEDQS